MSKEKPEIPPKPVIHIVGGLNDSNKATEEIQKIVDSLAEEIKLKSGKNDYPHFKVVSFKTQVVAGTNYFIKVDAGSEHLHLRIFEPLRVYGDKLQLVKVLRDKKLEDELSYF